MNPESRPSSSTSNYGWAVWHLEKAEETEFADTALYHAQAATARAVLAQIDAQDGPPPGTTWTS